MCHLLSHLWPTKKARKHLPQLLAKIWQGCIKPNPVKFMYMTGIETKIHLLDSASINWLAGFWGTSNIKLSKKDSPTPVPPMSSVFFVPLSSSPAKKPMEIILLSRASSLLALLASSTSLVPEIVDIDIHGISWNHELSHNQPPRCLIWFIVCIVVCFQAKGLWIF